MDQENISIGFDKIKTVFSLIEAPGTSLFRRELQIPRKDNLFQFSSKKPSDPHPQNSTPIIQNGTNVNFGFAGASTFPGFQLQPNLSNSSASIFSRTKLFSEITVDILHDANSDDVTLRISHGQTGQGFINWADFKFATISIKFLKPTLCDEEEAENSSTMFKCMFKSPCEVSLCQCQQTKLCLRGYLCPFETLQDFFDSPSVSMKVEGKTSVPIITAVVSVTFYMEEPCTTEFMIKQIREDYFIEPAKRILSDGLHTDFVLECDGKEFPCHKSILAAHSDVFVARFTAPMSERDSNRMVIEDMFPRSLDAFLKYLYFGDTSAPLAHSEIAFDLLRAGHKYQIEHVEKVASSIISMEEHAKFDTLTTLALFVFCRKVERFKNLKEIAVVILKTRASELVKLTEFDELLSKEPSVVKDLFKEISFH